MQIKQIMIGIIPARYASTRFPGKLLADLNGKPVLQWTWEQACKVKSLDRVVIAAGDERIADAARGFGADVVDVFKDYASGSDRIAEAVNKLEADGERFDIVVNIQGDEPLLNPDDVDIAVTRLQRYKDAGVATLAAPITDEDEYRDPSVVKLVADEGGRALYFSRTPIPYLKDFETGLVFKHIGLYVYRRKVLANFTQWQPCKIEEIERLEQLRLLYYGVKVAVVVVEANGVGVDTEEDLERVKEFINGRSND
ncbi:MAG: 3-deoxy-manno-octulosonate cytidylyltransferase [Candidatus Hatepunaea meridiana]|nr:3-deoxy-manno-octulosonate cytidylyltransferase [Candidatus Hatepunaea meridiana]